MSYVAIVLLRKINSKIYMFMVSNKKYNANCPDCRACICTDHLKYGNPAGKIERGEDFKQAAYREFLEETNHKLPEFDPQRCSLYLEHDTFILMYVLKEDQVIEEQIINNDEIAYTEWVDIECLSTLPLLDICKKMYPKYKKEWLNLISRVDNLS